MAHITVVGANVPRASNKTIQSLIDMGVLYIGEDNQLHALDVKENMPTPPTKAE